MCGIAGFVSNQFSIGDANIDWLIELGNQSRDLKSGADSAEQLNNIVDALETHFSNLMSISTIRAACLDESVEKKIRQFAEALANHEKALTQLSEAGATELDPLIERLRDYGWQLRAEVADHANAACALASKAKDPAGTAALHVAIASEYVLRAIDRLEVRGRDSAGIAIQIDVAPNALDAFSGGARKLYDARRNDLSAGDLAIYEGAHSGNGLSVTLYTKQPILLAGLETTALRCAVQSATMLCFGLLPARRPVLVFCLIQDGLRTA